MRLLNSDRRCLAGRTSRGRCGELMKTTCMLTRVTCLRLRPRRRFRRRCSFKITSGMWISATMRLSLLMNPRHPTSMTLLRSLLKLRSLGIDCEAHPQHISTHIILSKTEPPPPSKNAYFLNSEWMSFCLSMISFDGWIIKVICCFIRLWLFVTICWSS